VDVVLRAIEVNRAIVLFERVWKSKLKTKNEGKPQITKAALKELFVSTHICMNFVKFNMFNVPLKLEFDA
jgi:hypothetical protein